MDFNVNYVSGNTCDNEPNSKQALGKSSVEQIDNYKMVLHSEKSPARPMLFYSTNYWHQF